MLFFFGIWMLCHHGQSPKKGEKSKQRFLGYNEKTHFPFVKSARKPRNVSFLTQNPRFLRIVGYPAAGKPGSRFEWGGGDKRTNGNWRKLLYVGS